jgi:hypothetical protein
MFFRANSPEELRELQEKLARDRIAPTTRVRLEGGPMDGWHYEFSPLEIQQGMLAVCHTGNRKRVNGAYRPSDQPDVWRYSTLA